MAAGGSAQQAERVRRIGVLISQAADDLEMNASLTGFRQELQRLGWSEGSNVRIDTRFAHGNLDQTQVLAKELIALQPDVILAHSMPVAAALQRESGAIPIVFVNVSDPVGSGLVASLARPGGNLTGLLMYEASIVGKWLAMLKEIAPRMARAAFVANPKIPTYEYYRSAMRRAWPLAARAQPAQLRRRRRPDKARAYCVDTDATRRVLESRAFGETQDSVLGRVVDATLGAPYESSERRAINDRTTSLFAHVLQLEFHATPFAT